MLIEEAVGLFVRPPPIPRPLLQIFVSVSPDPFLKKLEWTCELVFDADYPFDVILCSTAAR